jgi:hypothetical protein
MIKKLFYSLLAVLLLLGADGTAVAVPFGMSSPCEIPIGESDVAGKGHTFNKWLINNAEIVACDVSVDGDAGQEHYNRTYNILLSPDTVWDAPVNVFWDITKGSGNYLLVTTTLGTSAQITYGTQPLYDDEGQLKGLDFNLENGFATKTLYIVYNKPSANGQPGTAGELVCTTNVFNFTVAEPDTSNDPASENVASIAITTPPNRTEYFDGGRFDRAGMVVTATLLDGGDVPINGYTVTPETLTLGTSDVTVTFGEGEHIFTTTQAVAVLPSTSIGNVTITNGQLMGDLLYLGYGQYQKKIRQYDAVVWHGQSEANVTFNVGEGSEVYIGATQKSVEDGVCMLSLPASLDGTLTTVTLKSGTAEIDYSFTFYTQQYSGMPSRVTEYLCMASQYTNGSSLGAYGLNAVSTLRGVKTTSATGWIDTGPTSLGNFGGYIAYEYDAPIIDDPQNPYGVDFIVYGNSHDGTAGFAEPGNVLVSEDGQTWYTLAGSLHYNDGALWNYSIAYEKTVNGRAAWSDSIGGSGAGTYAYPIAENYPLFPWSEATKQQITLTGTLLTQNAETNEYGNIMPPYTDFGYADVGVTGSSNIAANPYAGLASPGYTGRMDAFDLKWAVDSNGQPVDLSSAEIRYVKVQTASNITSGAIGEKSTEIHMIRTAAPADASVGRTAAPTAITVDNKPVAGPADNGVTNGVPVSGAFMVNVETSAGNVYVNSIRGGSATFTSMPNHRMLRVIVQDGQREPWIGYFNLVDGEPDENDVYSEVTFDPAGGAMVGPLTRTYMPEMRDDDKVFPIPAYQSREFLGWYDENNVRREGYDQSMPAALTLTARWKYILSEGEKPQISVTFRLIGAKRSSGAVDLTGNNAAGYKGADYVTWISTKRYTMNAGDTNYDLFVKALDDAGLRSAGSEKNYVSAIWAPASLGDYKLGETTNGQFSGWMYTVGGRHPGRGLREFDLHDGDVVIWHYVNDYRYEIADWFDDADYPALGDGSLHNRWLLAPDVEGGKSPGDVVDEIVPGGKPDSLPDDVVSLLPDGVEAVGEAAALVDAADGEGVSDVLDRELPGLSAAQQAMFSVNGATGRLEANTWAVRSGMSDEAAGKIAPNAPALPIPTFEADVTPGNTALVTLKVYLGEFAGRSVNELAVLKLKRDGVTEELERAGGFGEMTDGRFIITDLSGVPVTSPIEPREYLLNVAIADNGDYDWNPADGKVFDPLAVTLYGGRDDGGNTGDTGGDGDGGDNDKSSADDSGGGCDAGFGLAGAALAIMAAARGRRRW